MWPQWTSMIPAWQWLVLATVPPLLVALYFLKLKRQPLLVPSTYLWRKSIEDLHVNSLWQRLRRSLLLLLQLLLLFLLFLALVNPTWQSSQLSGNRFVFLVDNSASMSATDTKNDGAPSRLDLAKQRVAEMLDGMNDGDAVMLISFSDRAETVQEYTTNLREARRRLAAIGPSNRTTSLAEALKLAAGLANPGHSAAPAPQADDNAPAPAAEGLPATLVVLSDFRFPDVPKLSAGNLTPHFVSVGSAYARNVAITSFAARRYEDRPRELEAVARLQNFSDQPATFQAVLTLENKEDRREVTLPPGGQQSVAFPLSNVETGVLRLAIDVNDDLAVDNTAWAVIQPPSRGRVLFVSPGQEELGWALSTPKSKRQADVTFQPPSYLLTDEYQHRARAGAWDLVIYDRCVPKELPRSNTFFIGRIPPGGDWKEKEKVVNPKIVDTERTHPLVQKIEVGDFVIAESAVLVPPPGSVSLFDAAEGSLFAIAPRDGFQDLVLGFEISYADTAGRTVHNTNWSRRWSFPMLIDELLPILASGGTRRETESLAPGQPLEVKSLAVGMPAEVVSPAGTSVALPGTQQPTLLYAGTEDVGIYEVRQGKALPRQIAVNLQSPAESDIRVQPDRQIKLGDADVAVHPTWQIIRRPIVKWLLLVALVTLMVEWYIYNRRVYV